MCAGFMLYWIFYIRINNAIRKHIKRIGLPVTAISTSIHCIHIIDRRCDYIFLPFCNRSYSF